MSLWRLDPAVFRDGRLPCLVREVSVAPVAAVVCVVSGCGAGGRCCVMGCHVMSLCRLDPAVFRNRRLPCLVREVSVAPVAAVISVIPLGGAGSRHRVMECHAVPPCRFFRKRLVSALRIRALVIVFPTFFGAGRCLVRNVLNGMHCVFGTVVHQDASDRPAFIQHVDIVRLAADGHIPHLAVDKHFRIIGSHQQMDYFGVLVHLHNASPGSGHQHHVLDFRALDLEIHLLIHHQRPVSADIVQDGDALIRDRIPTAAGNESGNSFIGCRVGCCKVHEFGWVRLLRLPVD